MPATDPESWGLTLRVADRAARASVKPFEYEPVPQGQTIVSMTKMGDDEMRSSGFALRRPMTLRIYAIGEGFSDHMTDYAWIVDEEQHKRVWVMNYQNTEHAGGAAKNRLFDGTINLQPGNYLVYYRSDGSHSYNDWNGAAPAEARRAFLVPSSAPIAGSSPPRATKGPRRSGTSREAPCCGP